MYLPDVLPLIRARERRVLAYELADPDETLGVNERVDLSKVRAVVQRRIHERHMLAGVTIVDPDATVIDADVEIGADSTIAPYSSLHGSTKIGSASTIGPLSTLTDARVGSQASVVHSYVTGAEIGDRVSVGPFAYLRPGTVLREGSKAGTFVEIKNSDIGAGTKVPHLSYIGDADIGEGTNLGAATITANYDGDRKHRTTIGSNVKTCVDTTLVAPVTVGDDAYTAAGSVITDDVPPGALGVARARQQQHRGIRTPQRGAVPSARLLARRMTDRRPDLHSHPMSVVEEQTSSRELEVDLQQAPDARLRAGKSRARGEDRRQARRRPDADRRKTFSNGEVYCRFEESVRGSDVFIVQPTCANPSEDLGANDALMELLMMIDAAVGGSAHRVIAVCPWYGYSRQDKKSSPREPISARLVARMLESAGIDRILTMDLHSGQIQGFFQKPCDHMTALFMLTQYFADKALEDLVVVAPDAGRVKLNKKFAAEDRRGPRDPQQGAPGSAGRRDRIRDR